MRRGGKVGLLRTPRARAQFLASLEEVANVKYACALVGVSTSKAYAFKREDPEFSEAWEAAIAKSIGVLEIEARRRAQIGVRRQVYQQGQLVGYTQEYSDFLMGRMLEAHHPAYRSKHEISGPGGGPMLFEVDYRGKLEAKLDELAAKLGGDGAS